MNNGHKNLWQGKWSPALIPYGCLKIPEVRRRLIGGVLSYGHTQVRRPPPQNIKIDLANWLL
jgi:hypothetical protein